MAIGNRIKWLRIALRNLDEEANFIAQNNPKAASQFISQVILQIERLTNHPESGRPGRVPGTRELIINHYPYIIPYRVKNGYVEILRVFHTSRKYPPSFNNP
jgi:toxin ParE1/3/4